MDYYEILGVAREATEQDIKKAFRQIARECHPDVTGDDPVAAERFKTARKAYETLIDPVTRGRYDRRGQRKFGGGSFFDAFYNRAGGGDASKGSGGKGAGGGGGAPHDAGGSPYAGRKAKKNPNNNLDLEDLFRDFGDFGLGQKGSGPSASRKPEHTPPPRQNAPEGGADVEIDVEVDARTARDGGTVTVVYGRLQRNASWRPGALDAGVVKLQDIADIRIIPGTPDGETLREKGLGDAGAYGGQYGDLIVHVKLVGAKQRPRPSSERPGFDPPTQEEPRPRHPGASSRDAEAPRPDPTPPREPDVAPPREAKAEEPASRVTPDSTGTASVDVSIAEAILGGRIPLDTPQGRVRISIPPGTSSGTKMRLKGKGDGGVDLFVVIRIVVPSGLDEESRRLIEEFARLNPGLPRE